jgi:hypothetical protein
MDVFAFLRTYHICIVCAILIVVHVVVILVLTLVPFSSFQNDPLYRIFSERGGSMSITYACTFALSIVLLIDVLCELKKTLIGQYGSLNVDDNVLSKVAVFVKKIKYPRMIYSSAVSDNDTVTTASISDTNENTYYVYDQGTNYLYLYANLFMIISFMIPSGMMLLTTSHNLKCIYYCSISQLNILIFAAWLNISIMRSLHPLFNAKLHMLLSFSQMLCFSIEKTRDILLSFYGGNGDVHKELSGSDGCHPCQGWRVICACSLT